jgi:single-strand DNA-binding protein
MIKLQIVGNLGKDCIAKEVNGKNVINFSVAHTERYKDAQGNPKERTTWVECAYWTDRTAVAQYLKKGKMVYAEGSPEADAYMNKDNQPAATLRMRVANLQLLGGNDTNSPNTGGFAQPAANSGSGYSNGGSSYSPATTPSHVGAGAPPEDDLPF